MNNNIQTLLDAATAEAKRLGHTEAGPLHLAAVIADRDPEAFESVFGDGSSKLVGPALSRSEPTAGETAQDFAKRLETADPSEVASELKNEHPWIEGALHASVDGANADDEAPRESKSSREPAEQEQGDPRVPSRIADLVEVVEPMELAVDRSELVDEVLALLSRKRTTTVLLAGPEGSGKSALLSAIAARLQKGKFANPIAGNPVVRLKAERILSDNPAQTVDRSLDGLVDGQLVAVDDLEAITVLTSGGAMIQTLARIRAAVEDERIPLILIIDSRFVSRLKATYEELVDEVAQVNVAPLEGDHLETIAKEAAETMSSFHHVEFPERFLKVASAPPAKAELRAHPGLLIDRIDAACARASIRGASEVGEVDFALKEKAAPPAADNLKQLMTSRVKGQGHAVEKDAERLALTRAKLDLRPERPDGVFLFVGPTGVGKTEMAKAASAAIHGEDRNLIRLDMSEYAHSWAIARLLGPQPGYVGYTEPDGWLTTQVAKQPDAVILLDEIEKAHPAVWNAFLQVFDAGRLSDARGEITDFSQTVIAMTSNLGAEKFGKVSIGFSSGESAPKDDERVLEVVKEVMPPELVNRIDEVVVFEPLSRQAIHEIAVLEISRATDKLVQRGYTLDVADDVIDLIARQGYDPSYGARHLQRNIERLLLQPLASIKARELRASVEDDRIVWSKP